jgi:hypothetical protein
MTNANWYPDLTKHPVELQNAMRIAFDSLYYLRDQATATVVKGSTVPIPKITGAGADGSITFNDQGKVTGFVAPT